MFVLSLDCGCRSLSLSLHWFVGNFIVVVVIFIVTAWHCLVYVFFFPFCVHCAQFTLNIIRSNRFFFSLAIPSSTSSFGFYCETSREPSNKAQYSTHSAREVIKTKRVKKKSTKTLFRFLSQYFPYHLLNPATFISRATIKVELTVVTVANRCFFLLVFDSNKKFGRFFFSFFQNS